MKNQKIRSMKVHEQSGYNYKATPTIILKGQWFKEMGFKIGDYITVSCEDGKLIITPDAEKAARVKEEAEFMDKEMKSFRNVSGRSRQNFVRSSWLREVQNITEERCSVYVKDYGYWFTKRWRELCIVSNYGKFVTLYPVNKPFSD